MRQVRHDLTERFVEFYSQYYASGIENLAETYPHDRSLYIDYDDLATHDSELAEDYLAQPREVQDYAEEALRLYDTPSDTKLGMAHVRLRNLPSTIGFEDLRVSADQIDRLVAIEGYVENTTDVVPMITEAAFECQRCGTMTYIPQSGEDIQEPHECQGCERDGPFKVNHAQSEFIDVQTVTLTSLPENRPSQHTQAELTVLAEDDLAGAFAKGDRVCIVGVPQMIESRPGTHRSYSIEFTTVSVTHLDALDTELFDEPYLDVKPSGTSITAAAVQQFVERSAMVLQSQELEETGTKAKVVSPFVNLLGWSVFSPSVQFEFHPPNLRTNEKVDYALLTDGESTGVVVEAKQEGRDLQPHRSQLQGYMRSMGAPLGILTNGDQYEFYIADPESEVPNEIQILSCGLSALPDHTSILMAYSREVVSGGGVDDVHAELREATVAESE